MNEFGELILGVVMYTPQKYLSCNVTSVWVTIYKLSDTFFTFLNPARLMVLTFQYNRYCLNMSNWIQILSKSSLLFFEREPAFQNECDPFCILWRWNTTPQYYNLPLICIFFFYILLSSRVLTVGISWNSNFIDDKKFSSKIYLHIGKIKNVLLYFGTYFE